MQDDLFGGPPPPPPPEPAPRKSGMGIAPVEYDPALRALAARLPPRLRLGGSSWSYPGWQGLVWEGEHSEAQLAKNGLPVYAQHPLLRTVSLDRSFYRPLSASQYARYAAQVPDDFRFVVKAPSLVTDALVRAEDGKGRAPNPAFLDPALALQEFVQPAIEGLGHKIGALVFQLSPLPWQMLDRLPQQLQRLRDLLGSLPPLPHEGVYAVEVRDPEWIAPDLARVLRDTRATYCLGLHAKLPPIEDQLPLLRALWPTPLVCRWNLSPVHGPYGYEDAEKLYAPYDRIHHPAPETHAVLARTIAGITGAGHNALVTISNHAEGCAPLTVRTLAEQVAAHS
ncbi:MAG: DUF72 domain-containing protein [Acidovorax sp.]